MSELLNQGPLRICASCYFYKLRPAVELFGEKELSAPGVLKAKTEWDQQQRQRAQLEMARAEAHHPFDYEPHHYAWCNHYTQVALVDSANAGDRAALAKLLGSGGATMDPVTGRIKPLYQLCAWMNPTGQCPSWTSRGDDGG